MKMIANAICPYCGKNQKIEIKAKNHMTTMVVACDNEEGGCGRDFAVIATVKPDVQTGENRVEIRVMEEKEIWRRGMRILPILFNTEMVRGILEKRKSATRRVIKYIASDVYKSACFHGRWHEGMDVDNLPRSLIDWYCTEVKRPPCVPGDILYVRETWRVQSAHRFEADVKIEYKAGGPLTTIQFPGRCSDFCSRNEYDDFVKRWMANCGWHPAIHMPKEAARIFLKVKSVRVERLQDITEEQAKAEGFYPGWMAKGAATPALTAKQAFMWFWLPDVWTADPWVWVIEFERTDKPEGWPGAI